MPQRLAVGQMAFITGSAEAVGAVHGLSSSAVNIYVENAGDFTVPLTAVVSVNAEKVVLDCGRLEHRLRRAIGHAHEAEDPRI